MNTKIKNILVITLSALIIFGFSVWSIAFPSKTYSESERRVLAQFPKVTFDGLLSGSYMSDFESAAPDRFPMRDSFRTLKAMTALYLMQQKDNNGLYTVNGYTSKLEYPEKPVMIQGFTEKLAKIYDRYIKDSNCNVYLSVIPDKNAFLAPLGSYLAMDYDAVIERIRAEVDYAEYIDIFPYLSLEDFYRTDQHWRQENIVDIAHKVAQSMKTEITEDFTENTLDKDFFGTYVGQSALPLSPDTLKYLTSDIINACVVTSYDTGTGKPAEMYDMEKAHGRDPYEMFLCGSCALLVIDNPNASTDRELVLFRDSFGSSLAPLLASGYSKITLVDLRYISSDLIGNYVSFDNADVLFMYSTLIINNSASLK